MFRCLHQIGFKHVNARGYRNVRGKISKTLPISCHSSSGGIRSFAIISENNNDTNHGSSSNNHKKDKITTTRWKREDRWDYMIEQLIEYKKEHGDTLVPSDYEYNQKLGTWGKNIIYLLMNNNIMMFMSTFHGMILFFLIKNDN